MKSKEKTWATGYKNGYEDSQIDYATKSIKLPNDLFQKCLKSGGNFQKTFDIG